MAGADREGRSDGLRPAGVAPSAPDRSVPVPPLDQSIAAHLGWAAGGTESAFPFNDVPPPQPWVGKNPLDPHPAVDGGPTPPWAAWAASIGGPLPEEVSPEALALEDDGELDQSSGLLGTLISGLSSMLIHLACLITLGLWITAGAEQKRPPLPPLVAYQVTEDERELELETVFLDEKLTPGSQLTFLATSVPDPGSENRIPDDLRLPELVNSPQAAPDRPKDEVSGIRDLLGKAPGGMPGRSQALVDDYNQALDRITQKILQMLAEGKVLVVWCFDQSESMKDDQRDIRARLERVYAELGLTEAASGDVLMTAVTSFGEDFIAHTERPTTDLEVIREAIDAVPVDPSGEEMMCNAVFQSIAMHQEYANRQDRQMVLILVSDESGDREENDAYLEATIGQALAAECRVYVLGREAVFGYPYARLRWVHPQTGRVHQLPMDRGPETAFVEALQSDGLQPRSDAHPSGYGPYAQSRLAWRTGGIFFMLPSLETDLVGGEKRRYDSGVMRAYQPDLRSREEILVDGQRSPLRTLVWKIVNDLDPHQPEVAKMMDLRQSFSSNTAQFRRQAQEAGAKAEFYFAGLARGIKALDAQERARDREDSLRWQANYDLIRAQLAAYAARVYLYRTALDEAAKKLIVTPATLPPDKRLVAWRIREHTEAPIDKTAAKMLDLSRGLYLAVVENHRGTPWAARAEWELKRHFNYPGTASTEAGAAEARAPGASAPHTRGNGTTASRAAGRTGAATGAGGTAGTGGGGEGRGGGGASGWGIDWYRGIELVPEYRAPRPDRPAPRPKPDRGRPSGPRVPVPKL